MKTILSTILLFGLMLTMYSCLKTISNATTTNKRFPTEVLEHLDMRKQIFLEIIQNKEYMLEFDKTWDEYQCIVYNAEKK